MLTLRTKLFIPTVLTALLAVSAIAYIAVLRNAEFERQAESRAENARDALQQLAERAQARMCGLAKLLCSKWRFMDAVTAADMDALLDQLTPFHEAMDYDLVAVYDLSGVAVARGEAPARFGKPDELRGQIVEVAESGNGKHVVVIHQGQVLMLHLNRLETSSGPVGVLALGQYLREETVKAFAERHRIHLTLKYNDMRVMYSGRFYEYGNGEGKIEQVEFTEAFGKNCRLTGVFRVDLAADKITFRRNLLIVMLILVVLYGFVIYFSHKLIMSAAGALDKARGAVERELSERRRAEETLKHLNAELDLRVLARTKDLQNEITVRIQAEDALRTERDRAQTYLDIAGVMFVAIDRDGNVTLVNRRACEILGYGEEELIGKNWFDVCLPERMRKDVKKVFNRLMAGEVRPVEYYENAVLTRSGEKRIIAWHNVSLKDSTGRITGTLASGQDVTERYRLEEQLRQSQKMEAIGQLAGGVAHDFNNQLTGIMGYADLLIMQLEDEQLKDSAEAIVRAAQRSADLTQQLLAFARKGKHLAVPVNLHKVIGEVVSLLQHSIDKRITVQQILKANPAVTTGDPTQLQNTFLNLAINARDAMPDGGELIFETSVVTLDEEYCAKHPYEITPDRYIQICVTDNGVGMDVQTQKHIFEPFFTTKDPGQGTGMGLAAVYGTVRNHNGAVLVYSEIGQGTTFKVYLPLGESVTEEVSTAAASAFFRGNASILMVDDDEAVRSIAAKALESFGYKVAVCKDGAEAIEYYRKAWKQIDLVILDMVMPRMGGRETFIAMREINPDIKALLSSGYGINGEAQSILDEGVLGFLQKPFALAELSRKIAEVLGPSEPQQSP